MKTAIIIPYDCNISGVIDCYVKGNTFVVNYNLCFKNTLGVLHLYGLSSRKPCNKPFKVDVPVFEGTLAAGKKEADASALALCGYYPEDIDTFVLVFADSRQIAGAGFASLSWNVVGAMEENSTEQLEKIAIATERGKNNPLTDVAFGRVIMDIEEFCGKLISADTSPAQNYKWYKNENNMYPSGFTAYIHLTDTDEFRKAYYNSMNCLFGVRDSCHTAIALESGGGNPFVTAADCALYANGYWMVGVLFEKDGQYFERIKKQRLPIR